MIKINTNGSQSMNVQTKSSKINKHQEQRLQFRLINNHLEKLVVSTVKNIEPKAIKMNHNPETSIDINGNQNHDS